MDLSTLWDLRVLIYLVLSTAVILVVLFVQAIISRQIRRVLSDMESMRREMRFLEEGVRTVSQSLMSQTRPVSQAVPVISRGCGSTNVEKVEKTESNEPSQLKNLS
jgi:hypothetical protein